MSGGLGTVHVVGAGLAGLAAAVGLAAAGRRVRLYEAGRHAGGRCRSYFDAELGCRIDNGNHLLLAGNQGASTISNGSARSIRFEGPPEAVFPFVDAATGGAGTLRPNRGAVPWWILSAKRRVPGTRAADYLAALALRRADPRRRWPRCSTDEGMLFRRLWEPLAVAALNTSAATPRRGCSGASSPRRSGAAARPAGRCCRARGFRRPSSTRRLPACARTAPRSASARVCATWQFGIGQRLGAACSTPVRSSSAATTA